MKLIDILFRQESKIEEIERTIKIEISRKAHREFTDMNVIEVSCQANRYPVIQFTLKDGRTVAFKIYTKKWNNGSYARRESKPQNNLTSLEVTEIAARINRMMEAK